MKLLAFVAALLVACRAPACPTFPSAEPNRETQAASVKPLKHKVLGEYCTAWKIAPDRWATARHCVTGFDREEIVLEGQTPTAVWKSETEDIAVLVVNVPGAVLPLAKELPHFGEPVYWIGYPQQGGVWFGTYDGRYDVLDPCAHCDGRPDIRFSGQVDGGGSGSPLFNRQGEVIGIVVASIRLHEYAWAEPIVGVL